MAVVHRFIRPDPQHAARPRAWQGEADIVILPCVRRERLSERAAGTLSPVELGFSLGHSGQPDDARS